MDDNNIVIIIVGSRVLEFYFFCAVRYNSIIPGSLVISGQVLLHTQKPR